MKTAMRLCPHAIVVSGNHKILLNENLPVKIKYHLQDICEAYTVRDKNWNSLENGNLIAAVSVRTNKFLTQSFSFLFQTIPLPLRSQKSSL